jgi:hypothetical protein
VTLLGAAMAAAHLYGPLGVAMVCPLVGLVMLPVAIIVLTKSIPITVGEVIQSLWRPVLSVLVMAAVLLLVDDVLQVGALGTLLIFVLLGGGVYAMALGITWYFSGKPEGLEYLVQKYIKARLAPRPTIQSEP